MRNSLTNTSRKNGIIQKIWEIRGISPRATPLTARHTFIKVKEFFNYYNLELPSKDYKFIRNKLPKGNARTVEKDMDIETIRIILQHLDVKGRALILTLASSGMRINEALSVTLDDIDLKSTPAVVTVRGETSKTGDTRITFISAEATQAINEWMKVRTDYIKTSAKRNNGLVKSGRGNLKTGEDDGRLFPSQIKTPAYYGKMPLSRLNFYPVTKPPIENSYTITSSEIFHKPIISHCLKRNC